MIRRPLRILALLLVLAALSACRVGEQHELPPLFPVPNASLLDEKGKAVQLDAMKGHVTVYNFVYTRCTTTCPMMTANMRRLTQKIAKDAPVRFVSISVDPQYDTPPVLARYAQRFRNDDRWVFLTGDRDTILKLSAEGFKLAAQGPPEPGAEPLMHSSKFAVADRTGMVRDYYGGTDGDLSEHVAGTIRRLLQEK
jgi:cytochrome oxidase Cu insertion factor (SCO1/SenC/PrrC family)